MSHETLADAWTALAELHDLAAGLREAVGHHALKSVILSADNDAATQSFRQLALELSFSFDIIRLFWDPRVTTASSLQDDVIAAITYLLSRLGNPDSFERLLSDDITKHIFTYALCAATCILRICTWDSRLGLRNILSEHANILAGCAPEDDDTLRLIHPLLRVLNGQYESDFSSDQPLALTRIEWRYLSSLSSSMRADLVSKVFERATDASVSAEERILPILDLCWLYWDTDCILIQACGRSRRPHQLAKLLNVANEADAIRVALEVRFTIQEDFAMLAMGGSASSDIMQAQAHILFRPSLKLKCLQDACNCLFGSEYAKHISELHSRQGKMHRVTISTAYAKSFASQIDHEHIAQVFATFTNRLRRWTGPNNGLLDAPPDLSRDPYPVPDILPLRPRLPVSRSLDGTAEPITRKEQLDSGLKPLSPQLRSETQPQMPRRQSRAKPPSVWSVDRRPTITETLETPFTDLSTPLDTMSDPGLTSPAMLTPPQFHSPQGVNRTGSTTTGTPSSNGESGSGASVLPAAYLSEKQMGTSHLPEAVEILHQEPIIRSPSDFEKSYPEVAINPISSIQEDNFSLFSDGGSVPVPTLSAKQAPTKRWPGLFKTSKNNKVVATPSARFFASGKFLIAWTRYGGACIDLNEMSEYSPFSINVGDIVLAAGGARRFAVVARAHEIYTLLVYNLGDLEPGIRMNLGGCPKAMDLSGDDSFLAIKYVQVVRIFDLNKGTKIDHKLPRIENTKSGPAGHLVSFSHDNQSFMASTRLGPERVYTYWSTCMDKNGHVVAQSTAPCGNIDDHGLTSLHVAGASARGIATGFLSTFTEKGNPVILAMSRSSPQAMPLRDTKNAVGSRIHASAMYVDPRTRKANLVLVNQNNDVFWVTDVFGRNSDVAKLKALKRVKSMKPEVLIAMTSSEEASVFWIDQKTQSGILVKYGRNGGSTRSSDIRLDIEPLCCV